MQSVAEKPEAVCPAPYGLAHNWKGIMATMLPLETNLLLEALPPRALDQLRPSLEVREFRLGEKIFQSGEMADVFFPLDGIMSLVHELADGNMIEIGMVGSEGLAGISGLLGVTPSPHTGLTQGRGYFARCTPAALRTLFDHDSAARELLLRWMHVSFAHAAQVAVCNRVHEAAVRLAHWFLLIHDRAASDEISVTQEFLGLMLGARRATINEALGELTTSGSVEHGRGRVRILDRPLLERQSCECYAASVEQYRSVFGFSPRAKGREAEVD
jgi:CRP-like cAMP-binding protein